MPERYVVVDGSNIATEGRSMPSLAQLDEAVRAFMAERPAEQVIVVVDASFGYRIDESERSEYEQAEAAGEIVSPPAGAIGRGDGFLLRIADRTDAVVLSNDSFQEFHAEYPWLFDEGRLMGGKPVPGVGWIFTPRAPVRGPRSREAIRQARKAQKAALKRAAVAEGPVAMAIAEATAEAIHPGDGSLASASGNGDGEGDNEGRPGKRARRRRAKPVGSVNDPLPFIQFIADHPLGTEVEGEVDSFTSHGAFVLVGPARCYIPLVAMGTPPPRSAKTILTKGEVRTFVVQALDPPRRGIELGLPGVARVAGVPTEETVEADIGAGRRSRRSGPASPAAPTPGSPVEEPAPVKRRSRKKAAAGPSPEPAEPGPQPAPAEPEPAEPPKPARRSRKAAASPDVPAAPAVKPARKRKAAAVGGDQDQAAEPVKRSRAKKVVPAAAPEPDPEPAPAKPRRSRKAAAAVEPPAEPAAVAPAPEAGGALPPALPPRARRASKAAPVDAPPATGDGEPPAVKKAVRKRATKKAAVETVAEVAAPEPLAPVKKARRSRKVAPPGES